MAGALVCVGGAILLSVYKGMPLFHFPASPESIDSGFGRGRWAIGCVALFAGTICWSSWFLLQTSIGKRYPCQYSSTAIMALFSAIQAAILSSSIDRELSIWILRKKSDILIVLYSVSIYTYIYVTTSTSTNTNSVSRFWCNMMQGMIGSGLCFVGMSWCVKKRGAVFTAAFSPLVQIMAAVFDVPVMHEQLHLGR